MQEKTWLVLALVAAAVVAYLPAPALAEEGEFRLSPYIWDFFTIFTSRSSGIFYYFFYLPPGAVSS